MRYWPLPSVTTDRVFSISASLAASTVTPGSTAPDVSFTTPTIALCACAAVGHRHTTNAAIAAASICLPRPISAPSQIRTGTDGPASRRLGTRTLVVCRRCAYQPLTGFPTQEVWRERAVRKSGRTATCKTPETHEQRLGTSVLRPLGGRRSRPACDEVGRMESARSNGGQYAELHLRPHLFGMVIRRP